jgi:UDP-N-acetylglucosamine acyltransferase
MQIKRAYKILYRNGNRATEAVEKLMKFPGDTQQVKLLAEFVLNSSRGIVR